MENIFIAVLILLALILLAWAINDIISQKQNKVLIPLLLLAPIIGPIIYFQTKQSRNRGKLKTPGKEQG